MSPPSPSPGRWPTLVLLLASTVGVPGSLIAVFKDQVLQHPGLTVLCVLVWELLVLIAGLVTDVWSKLRSRWVDRLVDPVDHALQALFSRYRRRYLDWIFYRHRDFDVKGLTTQSTYNLELEQVFVDLTIQPPPPGGTPADPIRPFPKELTGRRSIWDYLTSESFTDHLALIGAPGSGKTTLLKKIALQMTGRRRPNIRQKLPILLFLREHAEAILANPSPSLADVVSADLIRKQSSILPPAAWFKSWLDAGRCLILLDGLDEVASQDVRQKVVTWVENQIKAFPRNRFIISSRPHGYRSCPVSGVTVLEIQPFNRDQVRQFVQNWYRANEIHASGLGNSQTLTDLAVNPLLLTMIATVHRFRSSLPGRRVELYAEICEVFLGKRRQAQGIETDLTPAQKQRVLQPLAYHLMCAKKRELPAKEAVTVIAESLRRVAGERPGSPEADFLKEIENGSGLLLERESGIYSFAHLAFQEYLTAVHIRENGLAGELVAKVTDPWWHEVIRLYGAQGDASGILEVCLSSENPSVAQLSLAIDCLEEAREVDPEWRGKVDSFIKEGVESTDPDRFRLAAETMLTRRLRSMAQVDERTSIDPNYISHAEYQLFLDETGALCVHYHPNHWPEARFTSGQALRPVVGVRPKDAVAFCEFLSNRQSFYAIRLPKPGEVGNTETPGEKQGDARGFWVSSENGVEFETLEAPELSLSLDYVKGLIDADLAPREEEVHVLNDPDILLANDIASALRSTLASVREELGLLRKTGNGAIVLQTTNLKRALVSYPVPPIYASPIVRSIARFAAKMYRYFYRLRRENLNDSTILTSPSWKHEMFMKDLKDIYLRALSRNTPPDLRQHLRWATRVLAALISIVEREPTNEKREALFVYTDVILLEARISGEALPFEGIKIVRELRV